MVHRVRLYCLIMGWKRKRKIASSLALLHFGCYCDRISIGVAGPREEGGRMTSRIVRGSLTSSTSTSSSAGSSAFSMNPIMTRCSARPTGLLYGINRAKSKLPQRQRENKLLLLHRRQTIISSQSTGSSGRGLQPLQMGIRGLTGYVNKNFRGAVPIVEIRKVNQSIMNDFRSCAYRNRCTWLSWSTQPYLSILLFYSSRNCGVSCNVSCLDQLISYSADRPNARSTSENHQDDQTAPNNNTEGLL